MRGGSTESDEIPDGQDMRSAVIYSCYRYFHSRLSGIVKARLNHRYERICVMKVRELIPPSTVDVISSVLWQALYKGSVFQPQAMARVRLVVAEAGYAYGDGWYVCSCTLSLRRVRLVLKSAC